MKVWDFHLVAGLLSYAQTHPKFTPIEVQALAGSAINIVWSKFQVQQRRRTETMHLQSLTFYQVDPSFEHILNH